MFASLARRPGVASLLLAGLHRDDGGSARRGGADGEPVGARRRRSHSRGCRLCRGSPRSNPTSRCSAAGSTRSRPARAPRGSTRRPRRSSRLPRRSRDGWRSSARPTRPAPTRHAPCTSTARRRRPSCAGRTGEPGVQLHIDAAERDGHRPREASRSARSHRRPPTEDRYA